MPNLKGIKATSAEYTTHVSYIYFTYFPLQVTQVHRPHIHLCTWRTFTPAYGRHALNLAISRFWLHACARTRAYTHSQMTWTHRTVADILTSGYIYMQPRDSVLRTQVSANMRSPLQTRDTLEYSITKTPRKLQTALAVSHLFPTSLYYIHLSDRR